MPGPVKIQWSSPKRAATAAMAHPSMPSQNTKSSSPFKADLAKSGGSPLKGMRSVGRQRLALFAVLPNSKEAFVALFASIRTHTNRFQQSLLEDSIPPRSANHVASTIRTVHRLGFVCDPNSSYFPHNRAPGAGARLYFTLFARVLPDLQGNAPTGPKARAPAV